MRQAFPELSESQREILDPAIRVVEAGPGSGKTRALVARFMHEAERQSKGVALLSFTNAAVNEVRRRAGSDRLLRAPHFVGTIDAFLHRFIVTPRLVATLGKRPTYLPLWRELPSHHETMVRVKAVHGAGIGLDKFASDGIEIALTSRALSATERRYLEQVDAAGQRSNLVSHATKRISAYIQAGIYDAATARTVAYVALSGDARPDIVNRLNARFGLLLVDEAQDCDAAEIGVLRLLAASIDTVLVADPDQCIYEFRAGDPKLFEAYRDDQAQEAQMRLNENHRSTTAICGAVTALRAAGVGRIEAADEADCAPILLISGTKAEQRTTFRKILPEYGVDPDAAIVLAHAAKSAAAVAGRTAPKPSKAAGSRLAAVCAVLARPERSPTERLRAITETERVLLSLLEWEPNDPRSSSRTAQLEILGRTAAWLRASAGAVVAELTRITDADQFGRTARELVAEVLAGLPRACAPLGPKLKKPDPSAWSHRTAPPRTDVLAYDRIHGCKGQEFPAVLLSLNDLRRDGGRDVLDDWSDGRNTEARRVLYVGASRAEHVLAFGGPERVMQRVRVMLERAEVPVRCL